MEETQSSTTVTLQIGAETTQPAPADLVDALTAIEVIQGVDCPSGFQLSFETDRYALSSSSSTADYPLLDTDLLNPFYRVQVLVEMNSTKAVLIDGFITRRELNFTQGGGSTLVVTGEDVSVKMDLFEISVEYPNLTDSAIATQILGKYGALGVTADVQTPSDESAPQDFVPQQNSTDRYYLQVLAAQHAYHFYIRPGSQAGQNTAYWGPLDASGDPQPALTANMAPLNNNLMSINFTYHGLYPTLTYGQALDLTQKPAKLVPIAIGTATQTLGLSTTLGLDSSLSSLASDPTSFTSQLSTLNARGSLLYHAGLPVTDATNRGQAKTNYSVEDVIVAEGEIDVSDYGEILTAPGTVQVRGMGKEHDGLYFVRQVRHHMRVEEEEWRYTQSFVLIRGGVGSTISEVEE